MRNYIVGQVHRDQIVDDTEISEPRLVLEVVDRPNVLVFPVEAPGDNGSMGCQLRYFLSRVIECDRVTCAVFLRRVAPLILNDAHFLGRKMVAAHPWDEPVGERGSERQIAQTSAETRCFMAQGSLIEIDVDVSIEYQVGVSIV